MDEQVIKTGERISFDKVELNKQCDKTGELYMIELVGNDLVFYYSSAHGNTERVDTVVGKVVKFKQQRDENEHD